MPNLIVKGEIICRLGFVCVCAQFLNNKALDQMTQDNEILVMFGRKCLFISSIASIWINFVAKTE